MSGTGPVPLARARAAQARALEVLADITPRAAVGIAREGDGFVLQVVLAGPEPAAPLPEEVEGVPLRVKVVGPLRPRGG